MKRIFSLLVLCGFLAACDNVQDSGKNPTYICGNYEMEITFSDDGNTLHAVISGDAVDLSLSQSASGARYAGVLNDTSVILWNKGETWTMFVGSDETMIECFAK